MSTRAEVIPDAVWERQRSNIETLYSTGKLDFVVRQMQEKFGFDATEKQYKRRFAKWKIKKNIKGHEIQRLLADHSASLTLNGVPVPGVKIKRHLRRRFRGQAQDGTIGADNKISTLSQALQAQQSPLDCLRPHDHHSTPSRSDTQFLDGDSANCITIVDDPITDDLNENQTGCSLSSEDLAHDSEGASSPAATQSTSGVPSQNGLLTLVHAILLHKTLLLKSDHFNSRPSGHTLVKDVTAAGPLDLNSIAQTVSKLSLSPVESDQIFVAAHYLYRRRGIFLSTGVGTSDADNICVAINVAALYARSRLNMGAPRTFTASEWTPDVAAPMRLYRASVTMMIESYHRQKLDTKTWREWRWLMQSVSQDLAQRYGNSQYWHQLQSGILGGEGIGLSLEQRMVRNSLVEFNAFLDEFMVQSHVLRKAT